MWTLCSDLEATPTSAYLVLEDPYGGREIQLDSADEWKLGRSEKCALSITHSLLFPKRL